MLQLARAIVGVAFDVLKLVASFLRPSSAIRAENLVLRKQLASYIERGIKPRRVDHATREVSATYSRAQWSWYLNLAVSKAKGKNIVAGQSLFGADELAYIADHYIYLDHDQRYSLAGGLTYRFGASRVSGDVIYGSGLRRNPDGAPPNSGKLASYATMNLAFVHSWKESPVGNLERAGGDYQSFRQDFFTA
jgi:hypothetical protein